MKFDISSVEKNQFSLTRITDPLLEDLYTFLITSHSILLRMRNVSDKVVEKFTTHVLCSVTFSLKKIVPFTRLCGKYCRIGQATCDTTAHALCMLDN
jgi:hypothetical protein